MIIVSGFRRTGTSAMMQALFAALDVECELAYTKDDGKGNVEKDGYAPNPMPLYEIGGHARNGSFLRGLMTRPRQVLVKIFFDSLPNIPVGEHTVVFMDRDEEEIRASLERVYQHFKDTNHTDHQPVCEDREFDVFGDYDQDDIEHVVGIMEQRKDVKLVRVNYRDLVTDPEKEFARISQVLPLDIHKAASLIDSRYWRARNDEHREGRSDRLRAAS